MALTLPTPRGRPRALVLLLTAAVAATAPGAAAAPIGNGLLGATEEQIARKLGPADEAAAEKYMKTAEAQPIAPAVRTAFFPWKTKKDAYLVFGFDKDDVARNVQVFGPALTDSLLVSSRSAIASGWATDKDALKVYPGVDNATLGASDYMVWRDTGAGIKVGRSTTKIDRIDREGIFRAISASKNGEAYATAEVYFWSRGGTPVRVRSVVITDAESFWTAAIDELVRQWKEGRPVGDPKKPDRPSDREYEVWLTYTFRRHHDEQGLVADRLSAAVAAMVRNPGVDLKPARLPAQLVARRHDQTLSKQLLTTYQAAPDGGALRERAATILGLLDDPAAVEPLIRGLRGAKPSPAAAKALEQITGQEHGVDAEKWQAWWQENRKEVQQAYEARQRERSGTQKVARATDSKVYHRPTPESGSLTSDVCAALLKETSKNKGMRIITLKEAREAGCQACPKCKPPR